MSHLRKSLWDRVLMAGAVGTLWDCAIEAGGRFTMAGERIIDLPPVEMRLFALLCLLAEGGGK